MNEEKQPLEQLPGSAPDAVESLDASAAEPEKAPEATWKKVLKFILKFGVSAGILTYIICTRDIKWQDFKLVNPWCIAAAFLCIYTQLALTGVRWFTLLRTAGVTCSFWEAISLQM